MHARVLSAFFRKGQVIETFRGEGVYQPAVDLAIEKLRAGAWVRAFMFVFFVPCFVIIVFCFPPPPTTHLNPTPDRPCIHICIYVQIHLFGEGKVCQSHTYQTDPHTGIARLQRFKWGMCVISTIPFFF
jgi:hypothetical protein